MKYYTAFLNLRKAREFALEGKDVFLPLLQESLVDKMLCGCGNTEDDALDYAIENLIFENVLEICKCHKSAADIILQLPRKEALRHLWLEQDECHGDSKLYALAYHNTLIDFCRRYSLTETAQREIESVFYDILRTVH